MRRTSEEPKESYEKNGDPLSRYITIERIVLSEIGVGCHRIKEAKLKAEDGRG